MGLEGFFRATGAGELGCVGRLGAWGWASSAIVALALVGLGAPAPASAHAPVREARSAIGAELSILPATTKLAGSARIRHLHCSGRKGTRCSWSGESRHGGWRYRLAGRAMLRGGRWQVRVLDVDAPELAPLRSLRRPMLGLNEHWAALSEYLPWAVNVGAGVIRFPLGWNVVEEVRGTYVWGYYDVLAERAQALGLQLILTPQDSPCWARPELGCPGEPGGHPPDAAHLDDFARFLAAAAKRYPNVAAVEVWNEPNLVPYYLPRPDPEHYARMLAAAYPAVKAARPEVPVLFAGLASVRNGRPGDSAGYMDFLQTAHEHGAGEHYDALAFHPYIFPFDRPDYVPRLRRMTAELKGELARIGEPDRDLWITEFGFATSGPAQFGPLSEGEQAQRLSVAYRTFARIPGIPVVVAHRLFDTGGPESPESGWGLVRSDRIVAKPAYCMLAAQTGASCAIPPPPAVEPAPPLDLLPLIPHL